MTAEARALDKAAAERSRKLDQLLGHIEPFFHNRPLVYVDVGAYTGEIFGEIQRSGLRLQAAHLIEPNPASFAALERTVAALAATGVARCYNLALSDRPGQLCLRDAADMSKVIPAEEAALGSGFEVEATTLDMIVAGFVNPHVSLLKIDVEGHEIEVLAGAAGLLERQAVDMIYIEAGMNPAGTQQTYYRRIEDLLRPYGYRLFRIYEQTNEWQQDSPFLRRVNLAFMSESFAAKNPLHLSRELLALRRRRDQLQATLKETEATAAASREVSKTRIGTLEAELATARTAQETAHAARETERAALEVERAAQAAAAAKARAEAEAGRSETEALRTELAALRDRASGLEARLAETARSLADREDEARESRRLKQELQRLQAYGRTLETRHLQILRSNTWRAMEPARRTMRLLTGKKAPPQFKPILGRQGTSVEKTHDAPAPKSAPTLSGKSRRAADELLKLTSKQDFVTLVARERAYAAEAPTDKSFFLERFCQLLALSSLSAYSEVARIADALAARFGDRHPWLVRTFGAAAYDRYVAEAAMALTRVGRYAEAVPLIDAALVLRDRPATLLQLRAEVCWPYAPKQALADIAECRAKGGPNRILTLMQAYLETMVLGRPATPGAADGDEADGHPQMPLIAASVALKAGDFGGYRTHLNCYFESQGLLAPLAGSTSRFAFDDLVQTGVVQTRTVQTGVGGARRDGPLVSVIMTTYNSAETLDYAVASLRQQSHGNLEILIVDDGSTDGTRARLAELQAEDPRIRVLLNDENLGTYCSKNRALERAAGAYVTMHDSDDWAHPDRIARHVDFMESTPSLIASRSEWLRLESDGTLNFRRWGRRFQHPNPASTFFRREAVAQIGFFDSVRFGADSEHWYRMKRVFGRSRVKSLPLCLGFGSIRADSLTRSGSGAMDHENYSPVRGAYAARYFYWHATASPASMKLPPRVRIRPFPAPPEMAVPAPEGAEAEPVPAAPASTLASGEPEFLFGISLASKQVTANWARTEELLGHTLRSVLNQSDPRFSVVICGHERPRLAELEDPRVEFVSSDNPPPGKASTSGFRGDKMRKRRIIGAILRQRGGGYFFPLDADDLVHRDVVAHVRKDDNRRGYLIEKGYALDYGNHTLAPVPGAWSASFDRSCGSSAVIYFTPEDLPLDSGMDEELYFNLFQSHAYWPIVAEESGRRLEPLPFPGGVYVVNHAENLSFRLQRKGIRTENIIRSIASHKLAEADRVLAEEFGQP